MVPARFLEKTEIIQDEGNVRAGLTNQWHAERFPCHAAFTAAPRFFISFARPPSLYCEEHVCIYIYIYTHI